MDTPVPLVNGRNYRDLRVKDLREELGRRWLPTSGRKCVLQAESMRYGTVMLYAIVSVDF